MSVDSILKRLGVRKEARLFFAPYCQCDTNGNLLFAYGDQFEIFGKDAHLVPGSLYSWRAGNAFGRSVFICSSAMEAIAFLSMNAHKFNVDDLLFVAVGNCLTTEMVSDLKKAALIFGRDVLGRLMDVKVAAMLRGEEVKLRFADGRFRVDWRGGEFWWEEGNLTLNGFERLSGFRSGIRTYKAKGFDSFLEQLKNNG